MITMPFTPAPPAALHPRSGGVIFLSYASEDGAAARNICATLRAAGLDVWFDENDLGSGDPWDTSIRWHIGDCVLFVAVVSAQTQARDEGYFRREWRLAAERTLDMADGTPFLLPVTIDATAPGDARVPEAFRGAPWLHAPGGEVPAALVRRVRQMLSPEARQIPHPRTPAHAHPLRRFWAALALGAVVTGLLASIASPEAAREQSPSLPPADYPGAVL